ncbi:MAG: MaoC family dehydratase N-terminal domain-containing protein [Chloroflexota bacterium]
MSDMDTAHLEKWVGNEQTSEALISVETVNLMAATLDREPTFKAGDPLPPAWHWLYFHEAVPASGLGHEGHAKLGGFLPPVPLPRRMWAGGRFAFEQPVKIGELATKRSTVKSVTPKQGRTGQLCFVIVEHEVSVEGVHCFTEHQTIVYRDAPKPGSSPEPQAAPEGAEISASYVSDPIMLFRYSALTFNGHRIHYDVDYCREVEGYPDLVVHGPLMSTLLLDLCYNQYKDEALVGFKYQARSPLFNPSKFTVNGIRDGQTVQTWVANEAGGLIMDATAELAAK